jgi:hypothetical protein
MFSFWIGRVSKGSVCAMQNNPESETGDKNKKAMRRSRSEDGDELVSGVVAPSSGGGAPHPVLTRPAFLSHIFKFVVRKNKDVKLLHVHSAWEDTAINYSPWMWQRLLPRREQPPPLEGTPTIEQVSQQRFNQFLCRVWARTANCPPSIFSRLVAPRVVDLNSQFGVTDTALAHLGKHATITELHLTECNLITDAGLAHLSGLQQLQTLHIAWCKQVTDDGLRELARLKQLRTLGVGYCDKVTDAGVAHIGGLKQLQTLCLSGCHKITDSGLHFLASLNLKHFSAWSCSKITKAQFKQAHPNCEARF